MPRATSVKPFYEYSTEGSTLCSEYSPSVVSTFSCELRRRSLHPTPGHSPLPLRCGLLYLRSGSAPHVVQVEPHRVLLEALCSRLDQLMTLVAEHSPSTRDRDDRSVLDGFHAPSFLPHEGLLLFFCRPDLLCSQPAAGRARYLCRPLRFVCSPVTHRGVRQYSRPEARRS